MNLPVATTTTIVITSFCYDYYHHYCRPSESKVANHMLWGPEDPEGPFTLLSYLFRRLGFKV